MKTKATSKIMMAALALVMALALATGTTFAWFSMNNTVTVTGMTVSTKVSSNLLIADDVIGSTSKLDDQYFLSSPLVQGVSAILEPVSTSTGKAFFYTTDAKADGSKEKDLATNPFIAYNASAAASDTTTYLNKFSEDYGVTKTAAGSMVTGETGAKAYAEYVFQLKATNTNSSGSQYIDLTQLDLTYGGATDGNTAFRVAIFVEDITAGTATGDANGTLLTYKPSGAANHNNQVVSAIDAYATASYVSAATALATVAAGETKYYKVVVRLWIEGQDTTCNNEVFVPLTNSWSLALELKLVDTLAGVTNINMDVTP